MQRLPFLRVLATGALLALAADGDAAVLTLSPSGDSTAIVRDAASGGAALNQLAPAQGRLLLGAGTVAADPAHDLVYVAANPDSQLASPPATGSLIVGRYGMGAAPATSLDAPPGRYFAAVAFDAPRSRLVGVLSDPAGTQVTQIFTAATAGGSALGPLVTLDTGSGCCLLAAGVAAWRDGTQELFLVGRRAGDSEDQLLRFDLAGGLALPDAYPLAGETLVALAADAQSGNVYALARSAMGVMRLALVDYDAPGSPALLSPVGNTPAACCYVALGAATVDSDASGRALFALTRDATAPAAMRLSRFDLASGALSQVNASIEGVGLWSDPAATLDRIFADDFE